MENNRTHLDKTNYTDVFLRQVTVGFLGFLKNTFAWKNRRKDGGEYTVNIPVHYSLTGDSRYTMEAFYDDLPDTRVSMNTDQIPRIEFELKSWNVKVEEFANPNVWIDTLEEIDDELIATAKMTKAVPVKLTFELTTIMDNEIDLFKCWQVYMEQMWIYRYFTFTYNRLPIRAVFNFAGDTDNNRIREFSFEKKDEIKSTYTYEIHTHLPIFDFDNKIKLTGQGVTWLLDFKNLSNLPDSIDNGSDTLGN